MAEDERDETPGAEGAEGAEGAASTGDAEAAAGAPADPDPGAAGEPDAGAAGEPVPSADPNESPQAGADSEPPAGEEPPAEAAAAGSDAAAVREEAVAGAPTADVGPADPDAGGAQPEAAAGPGDEASQRERRARGRRRAGGDEQQAEEVVPGAHLEPDLVLESQQQAEDEYARYDVGDDEAPVDEGEQPGAPEREGEPASAPRTPMDIAADARYRATGKRKTAVARVILRPGEGTYAINGRPLDQFFPRETLRVMARQPLEAAGYGTRMDVVAKIHGGGVSSQAGALRHGIARALVEADPNLRGELKRRGFLTRDPRVKERKKAGLKKARKRPQFSKR